MVGGVRAGVGLISLYLGPELASGVYG